MHSQLICFLIFNDFYKVNFVLSKINRSLYQHKSFIRLLDYTINALLGVTPLYGAAMFGRTDTCKFLVSQGADEHIANIDGIIVLFQKNKISKYKELESLN